MNGSDLLSPQWVLTLRSGWWAWGATGIAFFVLAWYCYRWTIPPLPKGRRRLLLGLRLTALAFVACALLGPRLEWRGTAPRKPRIAFLVDQSRSMSHADFGALRGEIVRAILNGPQARRVFSQADVSVWGFADTAYALRPDTLDFRGSSTAIGDAILAQRRGFPPPDALILVTDGVNTAGADPLRAAQEVALPVFVIGVGAVDPPQDARVAGVATPSAALQAHEVNVVVTVENTGLPTGLATIRLRASGKEIGRSQFALPGPGERADIEMKLTPVERGTQYYTATLDSVPRELTTANNTRSFVLKVLKAKRRAVIFAGAPSADIGFWTRFFRARRDFAQTVWFASQPSRSSAVSPADSLADADIIIWHDVPANALPPREIAAIVQAIQEGCGLLVVLGSNRVPPTIAALLPADLTFARFADTQTPTTLLPALSGHPIGTGDASFGDWSSWEAVPPLLGVVAGAKPRPHATVLLSNRDTPVGIVGMAAKGRILLFAGTGYWRWDLLPRGLGIENPAGTAFWQAAVRWLAAREASERVRIEPSSLLCRLGEPLRMTIYVSDERLLPLDNAEVVVDVDSGIIAVRATPQGNGRYSAEVRGLLPGRHVLKAEARADGNTLGGATATVTYASSSVEDDVVNLQENTMKLVASAHAESRYARSAQADSLLSGLTLSPVYERTERVISLGSAWWLLWGMVVLLSAEWALRRTHGLL